MEASHGSVSLSASGLCRCGLGGEELHSVQVSDFGEGREGERERRMERASKTIATMSRFP